MDKATRTGTTTWPWGVAVLRVVVGVTVLMHGQQKLFETGIDGVEGFLSSRGLPMAWLAAVAVTILEVLGGTALVVGLLTRPVALLLTGEMAIAGLVVHAADGFFVADGGVEFVLLLGASALSLVLTGPGAWALDNLLPAARVRMPRGRPIGRGGEAW